MRCRCEWAVARIGLTVTDAFVALTASGGGIALMTGLEGARFPLAMLDGTPFDSYVLPGLLLAAVVGGSATIATLAMLRNPELGAALSQLAGIVMVGWIIGEMVLLDQPVEPTMTEIVYLVLGLVMILVGMLLWHDEQRALVQGEP